MSEHVIKDQRELELLKAKMMAVRKESIIREASFLDITLDICGIPVKQFTPYHYLLLDFAINPYLERHRAPEFEDTCEFLWVISPDFVPADEKKKREWMINTIVNPLVEESKKISDNEIGAEEIFKEIRELWNEKAGEEIFEYYEEQMMDHERPPKKLIQNSEAPSYYCWVASLYHEIASKYGWSREYFLHTPVAQIFQLIRVIKEEEYNKAGQTYSPENTFSRPANDAYFQYINERAKANGQIIVTDDLLRKLNE